MFKDKYSWNGILSPVYWMNGVYKNNSVIYVGVIISSSDKTLYSSKLCTVQNFATNPLLYCNFTIWDTSQYSAVFLNESKIVLIDNIHNSTCLETNNLTLPFTNLKPSNLCTNPVVAGSYIEQVTNGTFIRYTYPCSLDYNTTCLFKGTSQLDAVFPGINNTNIWLLEPEDTTWSNWLVITNSIDCKDLKIISCPQKAPLF